MKKIIALCLVLVMLVFAGVTSFADYRGTVDGLELKSGINPFIHMLDDNTFEYVIYVRDMEGMTDGDFEIIYGEELTFVSMEDLSGADLCVYKDTGEKINISFMYSQQNGKDALKMFILIFSCDGEYEYPEVKVENIAGTYIKRSYDAVLIEEWPDEYYDSETTTKVPDKDIIPGRLYGDVDMNGKITAADARLVLRFCAQIDKLTYDQQDIADVNRDGFVKASDARIVLRKSAGIQTD